MEEILHQLRLVVYPMIYRVSYIPGGAGFLPSTVSNLKFRGCMVFFSMRLFQSTLYLKRSSLFEKNPSKCLQVLLAPKSTSEIAFLRRQEDKIRDVNFELPFETESTIKRKKDVSMFSCCKQLELQ